MANLRFLLHTGNYCINELIYSNEGFQGKKKKNKNHQQKRTCKYTSKCLSQYDLTDMTTFNPMGL